MNGDAQRGGSLVPGYWFSRNPDKAWGEKFFLTRLRGEAVRVIAYSYVIPNSPKDDAVVTQVAQTLRNHDELTLEMVTNRERDYMNQMYAADPRMRLDQPWLDRYQLEPYLLYQAVRCGYRVIEVPVTVRYHARGTTKMKLLRDGWRILRPLVLLRAGLRG